MSRRLLAALSLIALALLAVPRPGLAAQVLKAAEHQGFGRLVFNWSVPVRYQADLAAGQLIVQFDRPVEGDIEGPLAAVDDYIQGVRVSPDRRVLTFNLTGPFQAQAFTLGGAVVIDLIGPGGPAEAASPPAAPPPPVPDLDTAAPPPLGVREASHADYHRVVFDWPTPVEYAVREAPDRVEVSFNRPARLDAAALDRRLPPALKGVTASSGDGGLVVSLPRPAGAGVRHLTSGPKVVLDFLGPPELFEPPSGTRPTPLAAADPDNEPVVEPDQIPAPTPEPADQTTGAEDDAALAAEPVVEPDQVPPPAAEPVVEPEPEPVAASSPQPAAQAAPAPPPPPTPPAEGAADERQKVESLVRDLAAEAETPDTGPLTPSAADTPAASATAAEPAVRSRVVSLSFSWTKPTAAAVFRRGGYLWVLFDRYQEVDTNLLARLGAGVVRHVEQIPNAKATIVRLITEPGFNPSTRREGLLWIVDLMRQPLAPQVPIDVEPQPRSPVGPRLFLSVTEGGAPVTVRDPAVGDALTVVPVIPLGHGIAPQRVYPDLALPTTAQGVLVLPRRDDVAVESTRSGIALTAPGGLRFSPPVDRQQALADLGDPSSLETVFEIDAWQRGGPDKFQADEQALLGTVALQSADQKKFGRLELARFYFAHGLAAEALGVLGVIAADSPELINTPAFKALHGAASYMMGRYDDAIEDLSHPSLAGNDEAAFWRAAAQASFGEPGLQAPTLKRTGGVIGEYPRALKVPLAMLSAEAAIEAGDDLSALTFLDAADQGEPTARQQAGLTFLKGLLEEATGNFEAAIEAWNEVADGTDRLYRARALRRRAELQYRIEEIGLGGLIDQLEDLRFAWRGDSFEFSLMMRLGDLYQEAGDWGEALRVLKTAATYFKGYPGAEQATETMRQIFSHLFHDGAADDLEPVRAIALFEEFRELTPSGPKGDEMIRRLADRLVAVDLLPQAANLLARQVKYRLEGEEKARVGTRLAAVQLLDRKPNQALRTLITTRAAGRLDPEMESQRNHIMVRALADVEKHTEALLLLEDDTSDEAALLRADIYRETEQWEKMALSLKPLMPEPERGLALSTDQARRILDMATALTLAQDEHGSALLRRRYGAAMRDTPFFDAFDLITQTSEQGYTDWRKVRDKVQQAENFRTFVDDLKGRIKSAGLSGALARDTAAGG
ncbi:hypothetical protein [Roseospirillum parvum]|uniref:Tetratricopeptide repeat-containing protein n=1 Tax=Roseospirillum parvum TaxID=83401 RepID=A0A1G8FH44_9PROT|nr:hypothetical protein [Roseospirillum parvum]SDH81376.1 hypothetical protein SAMN05421742_11416 [Roseospirillum parvum]